jgi:hypothetical protein
MTSGELWAFLPYGYLLTIVIETSILLLGLSAGHGVARRLFAGLWLTACTYPIVVLVLPLLIEPRLPYLLVAETFAPLAECALFWAAFPRETTWRDWAAIVLANLASFGIGEVLARLP